MINRPATALFPKYIVLFVLSMACVTWGVRQPIARADSSTSAPSTTEPASGSTFTESQICETWGWYLSHEDGMAGIDISDEELTGLLKGWSAGLRNDPSPFTLKDIYPDIERVAKARREKLVQAIEKKNRAEADAYFAELKKNPNIIALPSGSYYEIIQPGEGPSPKAQQTVNVHFTGRLIDGTEFIQMGPTDMVLVPSRSVCHGWMEAIPKLSKGGKMKLYVPPPLSEKDADQFGIAPDSTMVFEIDLIDFRDTPPDVLADASMAPAPDPAPPAPSGFSDAQILQTWGWVAAQETQRVTGGMSEEDFASLTKGMESGIKGEPSPEDLNKIGPEIEKFVNTHRQALRTAALQKRTAESDAFFAELKKKPGVIQLPSGLFYEIVKAGSGPYPKPDQTVLVNYTGRLIDGTVFDSSKLGPLTVALNGVIAGWTEGLQKINKGGKITLYIPPSLAYGEQQMSGIPANSTLIFDIELLDIKPTPSH